MPISFLISLIPRSCPHPPPPPNPPSLTQLLSTVAADVHREAQRRRGGHLLQGGRQGVRQPRQAAAHEQVPAPGVSGHHK